MSDSQRRLWYRLRAHRLGFHFRREFPIGPYTLDFYCHEAKLCVEVDGDQHDDVRDAVRDAFMAERGIVTVRYASRECFTNTDVVAEDIRLKCIERSGRDPGLPPP